MMIRLDSCTASMTSCVTNNTVFFVCLQIAWSSSRNVPGRDRVEVTERLVHQQQVGLDGERAGDADTLLHAARQVGRVHVLEAVQADHVDVPLDVRPRLVGLLPVHVQEIAHHGPPRQQPRVLEDIAEPGRSAALGRDRDVSRRRLLDAGHDVQERALAAPRRTHHRDERLTTHLEVEAVQRSDGRLVLGRRRELLHDLRCLQVRQLPAPTPSLRRMRSTPRQRGAARSTRSMIPRSISDHHDQHDDAPRHQPVVVRRRLVPVPGPEAGALVAAEPLHEDDASPRGDDREADAGDQRAGHRGQHEVADPGRSRNVVGVRHVTQVARDRQGPLQHVDDQSRRGGDDRAEDRGADTEPEPHHPEQRPHVGGKRDPDRHQVGEVRLDPPPSAHRVADRHPDRHHDHESHERPREADLQVLHELVVPDAPRVPAERSLELPDEDVHRLHRRGEPVAQDAGELPQRKEREA